MKLDMNKLSQKIKNKEFSSLYLLYGEERYLVEQYKNLLSSAIISKDDQFNFTKYTGKSIDFDSVMAMADTMPFFSDYRLILIEDSGICKSSNDEFLSYMKEAPEHTIFIFSETEVDKRSKFFKFVSDKGDVIEFEKQKEQVLRQWLAKLAKKDMLALSVDTANLIIEKCGTDMFTLSNEMKKLCSYCMNTGVITSDDVQKVCVDTTPPQIFEMTRAMSEKNKKETLEYYYELLENKEAPMRILSLISKQFLTLYKISLCLKKGENSYIISSKMGMSSYIIDKLVKQASNFSSDELSNALKECSQTEHKIKTGLLADKIGVELLLVKYSG